MDSRFTDELWQGITGIYDAIVAHPFLAGLADGSLPPGSFAFYVVQDALYLQQYARALYGLGFAYGKLNKLTEARDVLTEAVKIPGPLQPMSQDLLAKVNSARAKGK